MRPIDLIAAVDVTGAEEGLVALAKVFDWCAEVCVLREGPGSRPCGVRGEGLRWGTRGCPVVVIYARCTLRWTKHPRTQ